MNETEILHKNDVISCFQVGSDCSCLQPGFSIDDELQQRPKLLVAQTSKINCKHFFTDSGTYNLFLSVLHGYFFMTFISIAFGVIKFRFPNLYSSVTVFSVLGSKIGPFHLNDLKCFKSPTCSVVLVVASPKYVPGEKKWRNDFCNCIFGSVFWKILVFFANWMLAS